MAVSSLAQKTLENPAENRSPLAGLLPALRSLDRLLERAVCVIETVSASDVTPAFRGLCIGKDEVRRLLGRKPAASPFEALAGHEDANVYPASPESYPLFWLMQEFRLSSFDADVLLLGLAPEIDLRYEKIYAYLQDDVTRKRPAVELALNLFCSSVEEKLHRRAHFYPHAPLVRNGLMHVAPDANQPDAPFLAHALRIDGQIVRLLLGQAGVDPRLLKFCSLTVPDNVGLASEWSASLVRALCRMALETGREPLRAYFQGRAETEKQCVAEGVASSLDAPLLLTRADRMTELADFESLCGLLLREARLNGAVLYISGIDEIEEGKSAWQYQVLLEQLKRHSGIVFLGGRRRWESRWSDRLAVVPIDFDIPGYQVRAALWRSALGQAGTETSAEIVTTLASRFKLSAGQITQAASMAVLAAQWRATGAAADELVNEGAPPVTPSLSELAAAARSQCGQDLLTLARKIEPKYKWEDIVLPADQTEQLREICAQAEHRETVYSDWGFNRKLSLGKGLNVLFCGPPGTGKTMAAEVIARELQLDLYRIDLSQVVSKYIGETEKNLQRIFSAAENSNAILFFDEADALFGKRSEVRDSHDRYANIEISYLLQKMEEYEGVSILATNLRQNLDEAFVRRLQFIVEFPFPDEEYRRKIWEGVFPEETPLADDVRFDVLARDVRLAGGNIKNMALAAAFYAAAAQDQVRMEHLIQAGNREHQKLGRTWNRGGELSRAVTR